MNESKMIVKFSRFASAVGYGYTVLTYIVLWTGESVFICGKRLHCTYGENKAYPNDIKIKPNTLNKLQDFLQSKNAFWDYTFEKPLDMRAALRKIHNL